MSHRIGNLSYVHYVSLSKTLAKHSDSTLHIIHKQAIATSLDTILHIPHFEYNMYVFTICMHINTYYIDTRS